MCYNWMFISFLRRTYAQYTSQIIAFVMTQQRNGKQFIILAENGIDTRCLLSFYQLQHTKPNEIDRSAQEY